MLGVGLIPTEFYWRRSAQTLLLSSPLDNNLLCHSAQRASFKSHTSLKGFKLALPPDRNPKCQAGPSERHRCKLHPSAQASPLSSKKKQLGSLGQRAEEIKNLVSSRKEWGALQTTWFYMATHPRAEVSIGALTKHMQRNLCDHKKTAEASKISGQI